MSRMLDEPPLTSEEKSIARMAEGFTMILEALNLDLTSPHLEETPERAARAWYRELCRGLTGTEPKITTFPSDTNEMIVLQGIPIRSFCSHHLLPFYGEATIAYIPGKGRILGLSKLSRIADFYARRPQVQEELTKQIADDIAGRIGLKKKKGGVGVVIRAAHMCMVMRGVNHPGQMITSAVRGVFRTDGDVRAEFMQLRGEKS